MRIFVCWDGDHIGREVGRAVMSDDVAAVRRVDQAINAGNELWRSFALRTDGTVIEIGGDEGRIELGAEHLTELPAIVQQYAETVGATVSVGVGMKLSESARALLVAKLRGGEQTVLWHPDMEQELAAAAPKSESEKIADEYLSKADGGVGGGHSLAKRPTMMHGQGDHEQGAVIKDMLQDEAQNAPPEPEGTHAADDLEEMLHAEASKQQGADQQQAQQDAGAQDQLRAGVVQVLQMIKQKSEVIAQLQQADPEAYQAIMSLVQGFVALGRQSLGQQQPDQGQPMQKSDSDAEDCCDPECGRCKNDYAASPATDKGDLGKSGGPIPGKPSHVHLNLPPGTQVNDRIKVRHGDGTESWIMGRSGLVQAQEPGAPAYGANSHPVSSRQPGGR